jgi:RNA polymerase sigma-70 factor, ECF subfamily
VSVTKPENVHLSGGEIDRAGYAALVRAAAEGDGDAMERLLMRAQEVAYRFSLLVCGHPQDAEDVMQDALLKTYRYVRRIKQPEAFRTWLYTTVQNACRMKRRRHVGEPSHLTSVEQGATTEDGVVGPLELEGHTRPADQLVMDAWVSDRLRQALKALPPMYRMIVVLREMEGLSTREVANVAGISEANVKTRLHRARVMLRQGLEEA